MKRLLAVAALLIAALPALAALPPFLFTPQAKTIKAFGSGYSIILDNGKTLSVDRFGLDYRITDGDREITTFTQVSAGWVEKSTSRTWELGKDGKWRTKNGDLMVARVIDSIVLTHSGGKTTWRQTGETWVRQ